MPAAPLGLGGKQAACLMATENPGTPPRLICFASYGVVSMIIPKRSFFVFLIGIISKMGNCFD
jgi:hypothetical protein